MALFSRLIPQTSGRTSDIINLTVIEILHSRVPGFNYHQLPCSLYWHLHSTRITKQVASLISVTLLSQLFRPSFFTEDRELRESEIKNKSLSGTNSRPLFLWKACLCTISPLTRIYIVFSYKNQRLQEFNSNHKNFIGMFLHSALWLIRIYLTAGDKFDK